MSPAMEAVLTMWPGSFWAIMRGTKASTPWITPQRFTPSTHSQSRWVADSRPPWMATPALLQTTCTAPISDHARSASVCTDASVVTSVLTVRALVPALRMPTAVSAMLTSSISATTTWAPSPAKARESARPIPLPPPVTTAVLPLSVSMESPSEMDRVSVAPRVNGCQVRGGGDDGMICRHGPSAPRHRRAQALRFAARARPRRRHLRGRGRHHGGGGDDRHRNRMQRGRAHHPQRRPRSRRQRPYPRFYLARRGERTGPLRVSRGHRARGMEADLRFTGILNDRLHGFYRSTY